MLQVCKELYNDHLEEHPPEKHCNYEAESAGGADPVRIRCRRYQDGLENI